MANKIDITGQRYGKLVVTGEAPPTYTKGGNKIRRVFCDCDCGKKNVIVRFPDIRSGHTQSCGCYREESVKKTKFRSINTYDLSGEYGIGYTSKGEEFWFDKEDYDLIKDYNWGIHHKYVEAHVPMTNPRKYICMHRLIMGLSDVTYDYTIDVDHIKTENKFDNRKSNLRIVTKAENTRNHVIQKNNSSGINGVYFSKYHNKWRVRININGKTKHYVCNSYDEAVALRNKLEDEYYGDYSYRRSQENANQVYKKEVI